MARSLTTKGLAKRIALDYFKKPHWFRQTKSWMSRGAAILAAVLGVGVIAGLAERAVSPGPVSAAHAGFETECARCHGSGSRVALAKSADKNCLQCHDGPIHHENQRFMPACEDCHTEHEGRSLAVVRDKACTRCHANLGANLGDISTVAAMAAEGSPEPTNASAEAVAPGANVEVPVRRSGFDASITEFSPRGSAAAGHHPEFRPLETPDPGHVKLNHQAHLVLKGNALHPIGLIKMECGFCHQPDASQRLMAPIKYEKHCAPCHILAYDFHDRFALYPPGPVVPHETPRAVRIFLNRVFTGAIEQDASLLGKPDLPPPPQPEEMEHRLPGSEPIPTFVSSARTSQEWVDRQIALAEAVLYKKDCGLCHDLAAPASASAAGEGGEIAPASAHVAPSVTREGLPAEVIGAPAVQSGPPPARGGAVPEILPPRIPGQDPRDPWLRHARFDHRTHRFLQCESCHGKARTSTLTAEVLLPGIKECAECHQPGKVRSDCALCHLYHDKSREKPPAAPSSLPALARADAPG